MAQQVSEIKAIARPRSGTCGALATRRDGKVPGVVYGDAREAETIALDARELSIVIGRGKFLSTVFDLDVGGKKARVIPREVQLDPVKDIPIHVDFQRIGAGARIRVNVPVRFANESLSPGLKRGGVLNVVRHAIEVTCPATPSRTTSSSISRGWRAAAPYTSPPSSCPRASSPPSSSATLRSPPSLATRSRRSPLPVPRPPPSKAPPLPRARRALLRPRLPPKARRAPQPKLPPARMPRQRSRRPPSLLRTR